MAENKGKPFRVRGTVKAVRKDQTGFLLKGEKGEDWYILDEGVEPPDKGMEINIVATSRGKYNPLVKQWSKKVNDIGKTQGEDQEESKEDKTIYLKSYSVNLWGARYDSKGKKLQEIEIKADNVGEVRQKVQNLEKELGVNLEEFNIQITDREPREAYGATEEVLEAIRKTQYRENDMVWFNEVVLNTGLEEGIVSEALAELMKKGDITEAKPGRFKAV